MKKVKFMVVAVLAMVLVFGVGSAMARDAILFPYFATGGGNVTFFQIINTAAISTPITGTSQGNLDYVYYYNYADENEVCVHYDRTGRTTRNDIFLFEASGVYAGQLLPGDTTSTAPPLQVRPAWGTLAVKHSADNFGLDLEGKLFGQAYVANVNTGTIFAYNAINDPDEYDSDFYFASNADDRHTVSFLPETYASTTWFFFPVYDVDLFEDILWNSTLEFSSEETNGVYDNNETRSSGFKYLPVGCWDTTITRDGKPLNPGEGPVTANFFYTLKQVLNASQYNAVKGTGGFTDIYWGKYGGYAYKFQSSTALGKPMNIMIYEPQLDGGYSSYTK